MSFSPMPRLAPLFKLHHGWSKFYYRAKPSICRAEFMQAIYINATSGGMGKTARQCFEVIDNRYVLISWIKRRTSNAFIFFCNKLCDKLVFQAFVYIKSVKMNDKNKKEFGSVIDPQQLPKICL